jgi:hypothetical protein
VNHCGTCTACCRVFAIVEIEKEAGKWCQHCDIGVGCKIYEQRPKPCSEFKCLWLQSQERPQKLGPELRPDRCKVVFSPTTDPSIMSAITMHGAPNAWDRKPARGLVDKMVKAGLKVVIGPPASTDKLMVDTNGVRSVKMTKPDETGMQWNIPEDKD